MTYVLELKPEIARALEAKAAQKGVKPEALLEQLAEDEMRPGTIPDDQFEASKKKVFAKYARVFEALAEGAQ